MIQDKREESLQRARGHRAKWPFGRLRRFVFSIITEGGGEFKRERWQWRAGPPGRPPDGVQLVKPCPSPRAGPAATTRQLRPKSCPPLGTRSTLSRTRLAKYYNLVFSPSRSDLVVQSSRFAGFVQNREISNLSMVSGTVLLNNLQKLDFHTFGVNTREKT